MSELLKSKAVEIVLEELKTTPMSTEVIKQKITEMYSFLTDTSIPSVVVEETQTDYEEDKPAMTKRKAFSKKDKIGCMICGESFVTLKRHLSTSHGLSPKEYREKFGINSSVKLVAPDLSEAKRKVALDKGLGDKLVKANKERMEKKKKT
jgi:predicted transcriptional regulator